MAHTEGWITAFGLQEQEFSASAFMGGLPRREGWRAMERLWTELQNFSVQPMFCSSCGTALVGNEKFCTKCGKPTP